jgi:hypothetical protein
MKEKEFTVYFNNHSYKSVFAKTIGDAIKNAKELVEPSLKVIKATQN